MGQEIEISLKKRDWGGVRDTINECLDYADSLDWFDPSFIESCRDQFNTKEFLSDAQIEAIYKIHSMLQSKVDGF